MARTGSGRRSETVKATVVLPKELAEGIEHVVKEGLVPSKRALFEMAVKKFLEELERERVDKEFEAMASDPEYLKLAERIAAEFGDR